MKTPIAKKEAKKKVHMDFIAAKKKLISESKSDAKALEKRLDGNRINQLVGKSKVFFGSTESTEVLTMGVSWSGAVVDC